MSLSGKKILVVGASGDIGSSVVESLEAQGAAVIAPTRAEMNLDEGFNTLFLSGENLSGVDGAVICHGAKGCIRPSLDLLDGEFAHIIEADLTGTFRVCREVARHMIRQGHGRIVTFSSIHAIAPYPERAAYAAAKAGVVGLTKALAIEWAKYGLQVNCVLPGQVEGTRRTSAVASDRLLERSPALRLVPMEAVTSAVKFLLECPGVNGHALVVDDGWTSSSWFDSHA